jgi:hypothetical protein
VFETAFEIVFEPPAQLPVSNLPEESETRFEPTTQGTNNSRSKPPS